jgi:tripartite-type tricarboxylate transporter receptor subunit TctC
VAAFVAGAQAQTYPAKPVRIVVPFPAGGSADTLSRTIGLHLGERLGQQFVVENRPGAGGNLGTELVAKSPPDGYTLLMAPSSIAIVLDVISGQVPVFFDFVLTGLPHVREGRVRALATTGTKRSPVLPDVPTVIEAGVPGYEAGTWFGVYAPAATPGAIVAKLDGEIRAVLAQASVRERFEGLGVDVIGEGPEALGALTRVDLAKWGPIVKQAGIKLD